MPASATGGTRVVPLTQVVTLSTSVGEGPPPYIGRLRRSGRYIANLRGYLMHGGGSVLGATMLTGRADSATVALQPGALAALRKKHGEQIENWWQGIFGYRFDCLTESEARYLLRVEDADTIRARLIEAGSAAGSRASGSIPQLGPALRHRFLLLREGADLGRLGKTAS